MKNTFKQLLYSLIVVLGALLFVLSMKLELAQNYILLFEVLCASMMLFAVARIWMLHKQDLKDKKAAASDAKPGICSMEHAHQLDNPFRKLGHNAGRLFKKYINKGDTVIDVGCGTGIFSIGIAKMVGEQGKVLAVDLQQGMLDIVAEKIKGSKYEKTIELIKSGAESTGLTEPADFIIAFYLVHEVPSAENFFKEMHSLLKAGKYLYIAEPPHHTTTESFAEMITVAGKCGFEIAAKPTVIMGRTAVFCRIN